MSKFKYFRPITLNEAFECMNQNPGYSIIAGGTDLMVKLKEHLIQPTAVIDLGALESLKGITMDGDEIRIGALASHTQLAESEIIQTYAPALGKAASLVGSPQIRNQGTIGGNMGNASPAADTVPTLIAYGALVDIVSFEGVRTIPVTEFFRGPGRTVLNPGELIRGIHFKALNKSQGSAFIKLGKRKALAISVVNAAAFIEIDPATKLVQQARLSLGSVAATAIRVPVAENELVGKLVSQELIEKVAQTAADAIKPIDDIRSTAVYRKETAGILVKRALEEACSQII